MSTNIVKLLHNNYSYRGGDDIRLIVLHTTEGDNLPGVQDLDNLYSWFNNPDAQVSAHVAVDSEGNKYRLLPDNLKAWTSKDFNSVSLNLEQIGHARYKRRRWIKHYKRGLKATARQLAIWSLNHKIPLRHSLRHGVVQHSDLGVAGGNHNDCGPGYPMAYVLVYARLYKWRMAGKPKRYALKAAAWRAFIKASEL